MGRLSHRKIRTVTKENVGRYQKWSERKTIFVIESRENSIIRVFSRTPFRYEGKMIEKYSTTIDKISWGSLVSKVAKENHIPFELVRYNDIS